MPDQVDRPRPTLANRYPVERDSGKIRKGIPAAAPGPARLVQEIAATAGLHHPHVLLSHKSGDTDSFLHHLVPCVDGEMLRDTLDLDSRNRSASKSRRGSRPLLAPQG